MKTFSVSDLNFFNNIEHQQGLSLVFHKLILARCKNERYLELCSICLDLEDSENLCLGRARLCQC